MITVAKLIQTCDACPSQWSGRTSNNDTVYIRYRFGRLLIEVNEQPVYSHMVGDHLDGYIDIDSVAEHTKDLFDFNGVVWVSSRDEV